MKRVRERRDAEMESRVEEARLRAQEKVENVRRMQRAKAYQRSRLAAAMEEKEKRLALAKDVAAALAEERQRERKQALIAKHRRREEATREQASPGPGSYTVPSTLDDSRGFRIGSHNPKSELEWQIQRAKQLPGPGAYNTGSPVRQAPRTIKEVSGRASRPARGRRGA